MAIPNKSAVITGGAMGIGLATAKRTLKAGYQITLWDINQVMLHMGCLQVRNLQD